MLLIDNKTSTDKISNLFKKYGIKSITMDDISNELGISKKTLYQQIADKNELIEMVIMTDYQYFKQRLEKIQREKTDAVIQLIRINGVLYEFLSEYSQVVNYDLQKYYAEIFEKAKNLYVDMFLSIIRNNLVKGKQEHVFRIELKEDIISKLLLSRIEQIPNSKIFRSEEFTSPEFVMEICQYHLHGIVNKQGLQLVEQYKNEIENIHKIQTL